MTMKQVKRKFLVLLILVLTVVLSPAVSQAQAKVSFTGGQYVKLGYAASTPLVWEVKALPGVGIMDPVFRTENGGYIKRVHE
jgi:hypothetical protein